MSKSILKIGYECNNNCYFCHSIPKRNKKGSINNIFKKIDELKNKDIKEIYLSGGEPLLNPKLNLIIEYIKNKNIKFGLITNSRLFYYELLVKELKNKGLCYVHTSLLGSNKKIHDSITRTEGSFFQTIEGIKNLIKNKIKVDINYVVVTHNVDYMQKTIKLLKQIGINKVKFSFVEPIDNNYELIPKISLVSEKINELIKKYVGSVNICFDNLPCCLSNSFENNRENLITKNIIYLSEFYEKENHPTDFGNKIKTKKCTACSKIDMCEGIFKKYVDIFGDGELKPI